jgi:hypothetical protein
MATYKITDHNGTVISRGTVNAKCDVHTAYYKIVAFGPSPKQEVFRSKERAIQTAANFAQTTEGCGSTLRVIECETLADAKRAEMHNHPNIGNCVWSCR